MKCELVKRVSQKGNEYTCLEITITDNIKKYVFLNDAELELIRMYNHK